MIKVQRRRLALATGAMLAAPRILAQTRQSPRVAFLSGGTQSDSAAFLNAFLDALRRLGYRESDNVTLDARYAEYSAERAQKYAAEMATLKPAVIVASGGGIAPAYRMSSQVPLVFLQSGNPVDAGHADSFARPGRNATGISLMALDLIPKRLELLREIRPSMRRIAFLASPEHAGQKRELAASDAAARQLKLDIAYHEARNPQELATALPAVVADRPDGALLFSDALMVGQRQTLAAFFLKHSIPSAAGYSAFPETGHLMSYGPERLAAWRRLAYFVDRIIKGARASDLPIELPTAFELVVNLRTAKAIGLTVPQAILSRSDRVIE